jgi:hypothetical protein
MYLNNASSRNAPRKLEARRVKQHILKKRWKPCKLDEKTSGLYRVVQTHVNGTVTIELKPGVSERLNIQRIMPYKE